MRAAVAGAVGVLLLGAGYAVLDAVDVVPGALTRGPVPTVTVAPPMVLPSTPASRQPTPTPTPTSASGSPGSSGSGLGAAAPMPQTAALAARLAGPLAAAALRDSSLEVRDVLSGQVLYARGAGAPRIPASSTKLLTAVAVARTFAPGERLTTRAVLGGPIAGGRAAVVLVAGGDALLSAGAGNPTAVAGRAGLADLAASTASALTSRGVTAVTVSADLTYAAGPGLAPTWAASFPSDGIAGPLTMLGLAADHPVEGRPAVADPAGRALSAFAGRLRDRGLTVAVTPQQSAGRAPAGAEVLGSIASAPVDDVLAAALTASDNTLTEALARQAAYRSTGRPAVVDFPAAGRAIVARLAADGLPTAGVELLDASGLSRENRVTATLLATLLARAAVDGRPNPTYDRALAGMPIAGLTGTLAGRFVGGSTQAAAGFVRAKTGTLTGASALAGLVLDRDGRLLAFAALTAGAETTAARAGLDDVATVLAGCGCR